MRQHTGTCTSALSKRALMFLRFFAEEKPQSGGEGVKVYRKWRERLPVE
jgi:hypothetical protein